MGACPRGGLFNQSSDTGDDEDYAESFGDRLVAELLHEVRAKPGGDSCADTDREDNFPVDEFFARERVIESRRDGGNQDDGEGSGDGLIGVDLEEEEEDGHEEDASSNAAERA